MADVEFRVNELLTVMAWFNVGAALVITRLPIVEGLNIPDGTVVAAVKAMVEVVVLALITPLAVVIFVVPPMVSVVLAGTVTVPAVNVNVFPTTRLLPIVSPPAVLTNAYKLFVVPGVVWSK